MKLAKLLHAILARRLLQAVANFDHKNEQVVARRLKAKNVEKVIAGNCFQNQRIVTC